MDAKYLHQSPSTVGLVAHYKLWVGLTSPGKVFDYSLNGKTGALTGTDIAPAYPGFAFNGTDDFIDVGNQGSGIKSILLWLQIPNVVGNKYPIDLNGTDYIAIDENSLTTGGFIGSTFYVDGIAADDITANTWHLVGLTIATAKTASDLDIGRVEGQGLFAGKIGDVMLFDTTKTAAEAKSIFEITRGRYGV